MTIETAEKLESLLQDVERSVKTIRDTLRIAAEVQWLRGPRRADPGPRGKGGPPSDPTGDTVANPQRLRVRRELRNAVRHLLEAAARLRGTAAALTRALDAWERPASD